MCTPMCQCAICFGQILAFFKSIILKVCPNNVHNVLNDSFEYVSLGNTRQENVKLTGIVPRLNKIEQAGSED